ncbi:hypothetical protein MIB92_19440 [Aestuariirhabdus sp. Z084]|uniref:hypothetical protein n=1 Tax=Aestuariirhabdus haliotis TaxID=2918751 RepID=UPI00201B3AB5|nr:hypothetical protein [Aestuariirhabdus haliotis]MCL6417832.1 hypothetical protein [Aestuariirhabdus haliotis]MCL6421747.1 hypothetical protein [Aestuariirhabdus haliotis]
MSKQLRNGLLIVFIGLLVGCGSNAHIVDAWVDPELTKNRLDGVMVIAVAGEKPDSKQMRKSFEDAFVKQLENKGIRAVASYTLLGTGKSTKEAVIAEATKASLDAILVTRYAGTTTQEIYHPGTNYYAIAPSFDYGYGGRFNGYYGHIYKVYSDPSVWSSNSHVYLVSDLYQTSTEKRVWQASSEALKTDNLVALRDTFISTYVDEMLNKELLAH